MNKWRRLFLSLLFIGILALNATGSPARAISYGTYDDLLLTTFGSHILALWPLNETTGSTAYDISGNARNGTYYGVTLDQIDGPGPSMGRIGSFDGINDYVDLYSNSLASVFSGTTHTIAGWYIIPSAATWSDGQYRGAFGFSSGGATNISDFWKSAVANTFRYEAYGNSLGSSASSNGSPTTWQHIALSVSGTGVAPYLNATPLATFTRGNWAATLSAAVISDRTGANPWNGSVAQVVVLDQVVNATDIAILADPNPPTPTPTPTPTATPSATPKAIRAVSTLENGQPWAFDHTVTAGQIANFIPGLILIGLLLFGLVLLLVRRK